MQDDEILPLNLAHNFWTWNAQGHVNPIVVCRAEGVYFWDQAGKRYLDLNSMTMCVQVGHGNRRIIEAMQQQAAELPYAAPSMATRIRAELGVTLAGVTPGELDRFFFTLGGADANENAIKLARAYTGRHKILARYRSYHGATHGAMALTGDPRRWAWEPNLMPGVVHFLDPYRYRSAFFGSLPDISERVFCQAYLDHVDEIIQLEGPATIAALLVEPVTGSNGIIVPPEGYMRGLRDLCDRHGILLIADEVMSGFGRTGAWFAVDHWDVVPDLLTMAKGLTSGYAPLGAVAMRPEIAEFFNERVYQGGLTYNSHPVSLAAAKANIQVLQEDGLIPRASQMGQVLEGHLQAMKEAHPSVGDVRSLGLFGVLELVRDRATRAPLAPFNSSSPEMDMFRKQLLASGIYLFSRWNLAFLIPPLVIQEEQLQEGFAALDRALELTDEAIG